MMIVLCLGIHSALLAARPIPSIKVFLPNILGYKIINADVLETNDKRWFRQGIVFAQKDSKSIGISTAFYPGTKLKR